MLGGVSIWIGIVLIGVYLTRCVLDDEGLKYGNRPNIPWVTMKSLDTARFNKKGWLDLIYEKDGRQRKLRLDEYHLANFDELINAICARREFTNPLDKPPAKEPSPV